MKKNALFVGLAIGLISMSSPAQDRTWTVGVGSWSDPANWGGGVPGAANEATINNGGVATVTSGSFTVGSVFLGPNTASGSLIVTNGSLDVADFLGVGHFFPGSVTVDSGGFLRVLTEDSLRLATSVLGSGTLTVQGFGVLETHSVREGTSGVDGGTGTIILNNGIVRALSDEAEFFKDFETGDVRLEGFGGLFDTNGHAIGISTNMTGTGGLFKLGAGTLTLSGSNSYSGGTTVNRGTFRLEGTAARVTHSGAVTLVGSNAGDVATLEIAGGEMRNFLAILGDAAGSLGVAQVTGGLWQNGGTLYLGVSGTGLLSVTSGTVSAPTTILGLNGAGLGAVTLSTNGVLLTGQVSEGGGTGTLDFQGGVVRATGNSSDFFSGFEAGDVTVGLSGAVIDSNGYDITISAPLDGGGGLFKRGAGTLTLSGSNSYAGGNTLAAGTLRVGHQNALGSTAGDLFVATGAALDVNGYSLSVGDLGGGGLVTNSSGSSVLFSVNQTADGTFSGRLSDGSGTLGLVKSGTGTLTFSGSQQYSGQTYIEEGGLVYSFGASLSAPSSDLTVGGAIGKSASLTISGGSISTQYAALGAAPGSTGTATITSGTWSTSTELYVGGIGAGTSGILNVNGGLISAAGDGISVGYDAGTTGQITINSTGVLAATKITEGLGSGSFVFDGGTVRALADSADFFAGFEAGDVTIDDGWAFFDTNGYNVTITTPLGGPGGFFKQGPGTLALSGSLSYTGGTQVAGGTLKLAAGSTVGSGTAVLALFNSGTLDLNGASVTAGTFNTSAGSLVTNSGAGVATLALLQDGSGTVAGSMVGTGGAISLLKSGTGTLTLTGSSQNVEAIVFDGSLVLSGSTAFLNSPDRDTVVGFFSGDEASLNIGELASVASRSATIGLGVGSSGTAAVDGTWMVHSASASGFTVGAAGTGVLRVGATGVVAAPSLTAGFVAGSSGTITLDPGATVLSRIVTIGAEGHGNVTLGAGSVLGDGALTAAESGVLALGVLDGSEGTLTIHGGIVSTGEMSIGIGGRGEVTIDQDGTLVNAFISQTEFQPRNVILGDETTGEGILTIRSGTWLAGDVTVGDEGRGALTIETGGYVETFLPSGDGLYGGTVFVGNADGSRGDVLVDGGTMTFGSVAVGVAGEGTFEVRNGGQANGSLAAGLSGGSMGTVTIRDGVFSGSSGLIGGSGTGSLVITDGGAATFKVLSIGTGTGSGVNTGTGSVVVENGTLQMADGVLTVGQGTLSILASGSAHTDFAAVGSGTFSPGLVQVNGGTWRAGTILVEANGSVSLAGGTLHVEEILSFSGTNGFTVGGTSTVISEGNLILHGGTLNVREGSSLTTEAATLSGDARVSGASWTAQGATAFSGTRSLTVENGGVLRSHEGVGGSVSVEVSGGLLDLPATGTTFATGILSARSLAITNSGTVKSTGLTVTGTATISHGTWEVLSGTSFLGSTAQAGAMEVLEGGLVTGRVTTLIGEVLIAGGTWNNTGGLNFSGTRTLSIRDGGALTVAGALNFTAGSLAIGDGGFVRSHGGNLGLAQPASWNVTSGTWESNGPLTVGGGTLRISDGGVLSGTGSLLVGFGTATAGTLVVETGARVETRSATIGFGGVGVVDVASGTWNNDGNLTFSASQYSGTLNVGPLGRVGVSGTVAFGSDFAGVGGAITVTGSGGNRGVFGARRIVESGTNAGTLTLDGGILQARANEADFLSGFEAGDVTLQAGGGFFDSNGHDFGIGAVLGGTGTLTKVGAGSLTLSGTNSYTGGTVVEAGTLMISELGAGQSVLGTGEVTVENGAKLAGVGTVLGDTFVSGVLAPGNSPGLMTFGGDLFLHSTALMQMELASLSGYDQIAVAGLLTYDGTLSLALLGGYTPQVGDTFDLFDAPDVAAGSQFDDITFNVAGYDGTLDYVTGTLTITAVPEPSAAVLLMLTGILALHRKRRTTAGA